MRHELRLERYARLPLGSLGGSAGWQGERKPPARYGEGPEPYGQAAA